MLNITADIAAAERLLSDLARSQLPFAISRAINDTADSVKSAQDIDIASTFDRPTPFTRRAMGVTRSTKSSLSARVAVKPVQNAYLARQVTGGKRLPARRAIVVPVGVKLNQYGNMPRAAIKRALSRKDVFVAGRGRGKTKHLPAGVYKRTGRKGGALMMLAAFEPSTTYDKRWRFHDLAARRARAVFADRFYRRLQEAIATARR